MENQYLHCFLLSSPKFMPIDSDFVGQLFLVEGTEENDGQQRLLRTGI